MKKIKKIIKIVFFIIAIILAICLVSFATFVYVTTKSLSLDYDKFEKMSSNTIEIFDRNMLKIQPNLENYIDIDELNSDTKNAFISAEDKRFYSHNGIDYFRIAGAMLSNLKSFSFSQGASTITQQLIKNTQLSNEKTISRKIKEIKLARQLEKKYSKNKILELYLNNIYFGNGCYGIENASNHYFSKSAKNLTLAESAILAGTINAPSVYDIESKPEKANERKNLILKLMNKYDKISDEKYNIAKNENVILNISKLSNNNFIYNEIINEACKKLKITENKIKNSNIKIFSYIDLNLQKEIFDNIKENYSNIESKPNIANIIVENETNGIVAINGKKNVFEAKRQPGSTIKPILVYAPAIEENLISPSTKILDEKINISGYSPENSDKKYHGMISSRTALKNSYNVPAVKLLNEIGIKKAQSFAKKLGIEFCDKDNNLSIALGGFTEGVSLKSIVDSYTALANNGNFCESKYIKSITKNHQTIYKADTNKTNAMKESTAYLITNMLIDTSKTGTAKRLKNFTYQIASKTGTVGKENSSKNSDAYCVSYTSEHTILSYFGGKTMPENINGSTYPTLLTKDSLNALYKNHLPQNFTMPDSVSKEKISKGQYENNIISKSNDDEEFIIEYFSKENTPTNDNIDFSIEIFNFNNKKPIINFITNDNYNFKIIRKSENDENKIIFNSENFYNNDKSLPQIFFQENINQDNKKIIFEDTSAESNCIYEYYVEFDNKKTLKEIQSNFIKLKAF